MDMDHIADLLGESGFEPEGDSRPGYKMGLAFVKMDEDDDGMYLIACLQGEDGEVEDPSDGTPIAYVFGPDEAKLLRDMFSLAANSECEQYEERLGQDKGWERFDG